MQLAGELAKMNLASLLRLVRNGELTGKICLSQGVRSAFIFFETGEPIHVESDYGSGREALLELFLWQSGTFSYIETAIADLPRSIDASESLEKLLKEGQSCQEALRYLEQLRINSRSVLRRQSSSDEDPLLAAMDGKTTLGEIVQKLKLSRIEYILRVKNLVSTGKALVVEASNQSAAAIDLPDWVISRLKQDNTDVSQAIVDLIIWADRIKCWLYKADVDLQRVIGAIESKQSPDSERRTESFAPQGATFGEDQVAGSSSEPESHGPAGDLGNTPAINP